jgi:hypothetical protein
VPSPSREQGARRGRSSVSSLHPRRTAFAEADVQRVFIWPVADERHQLERFWSDVRPLVATT